MAATEPLTRDELERRVFVLYQRLRHWRGRRPEHDAMTLMADLEDRINTLLEEHHWRWPPEEDA